MQHRQCRRRLRVCVSVTALRLPPTEAPLPMKCSLLAPALSVSRMRRLPQGLRITNELLPWSCTNLRAAFVRDFDARARSRRGSRGGEGVPGLWRGSRGGEGVPGLCVGFLGLNLRAETRQL